jgi:hypothetical protein
MKLLSAAMVAITLSPIAASDANYCGALAVKYERYLDMNSKRGQQPQGLDTRVALEKCKAGDTSGIPALEQALRNARIDLPPRS